MAWHSPSEGEGSGPVSGVFQAEKTACAKGHQRGWEAGQLGCDRIMEGLIILFKELRLYLKGKWEAWKCLKQEIQFSLNTERTRKKRVSAKAFTSHFPLPSWVPR